MWPSPRPDIIGTATPQARHQRREHQRDLVAHAAGRVLVHPRRGEPLPVAAGRPDSSIASVSAASSAGVEPAPDHRHQQRRHLVVRHLARQRRPASERRPLPVARARHRLACARSVTESPFSADGVGASGTGHGQRGTGNGQRGTWNGRTGNGSKDAAHYAAPHENHRMGLLLACCWPLRCRPRPTRTPPSTCAGDRRPPGPRPGPALRHYEAALAVDSTNYEANWRAALTLLDMGKQTPDSVKSRGARLALRARRGAGAARRGARAERDRRPVRPGRRRSGGPR